MGHLFSRALKRITQGAQPSRSQQLHNQSSVEQQDTTNEPSYASDRVQSIPVGQSIDSAEYAGFRQSSAGYNTDPKRLELESPQEEPATEPQRAVEEAAIKIQALVRGHLTRKALKDAQSHSVPVPRNALGQRQFDEECLLRPAKLAASSSTSPILLNLSPVEDTGSRDNRLPGEAAARQPGGVKPNTSSTALSSIAEHSDLDAAPQLAEDSAAERKKVPLKLCIRASTCPGSQLLDTEPVRDHSLSPVPSEANVSIDLNYDTPASASIDIVPHNIRPADKLASVLHHKSESTTGDAPLEADAAAVASQVDLEREKAAPAEEGTAEEDSSDTANKLPGVEEEQCILAAGSVGQSQTEQLANGAPNTGAENGGTGCNYNSNGNNHEEAAAIRIQSAFRGYRTRKNSPYRARSPPSPNKLPGEQLSNGTPVFAAAENRLAPAEEVDEETEEAGSVPVATSTADISREPVPNLGERRSSRPRARDSFERQTTSPGPDLRHQAQTDGAQEVAATSEDATLNDSGLRTQQDLGEEGSPQEADKTEPMMRAETFDGPATTTSNNEELTNELTEANVSELGTETVAALLGMTTIESLRLNREKRPSVKSEASVETIGSSIAGALLSLDDEPCSPAAGANLAEEARLDEDKSLGGAPRGGGANVVSLEVDELDLEGSRLETSGAEALIDQGGALVEDSPATTDDQPVDQGGELVADEEQDEEVEDEQEGAARSQPIDDITTRDKELERAPTLDEREQLTIELESDDIERRDPRGQATTERTKSPSILDQAPAFGGAIVAGDDGDEEAHVTASAAQLETAALADQPQLTAAVDKSATSLRTPSPAMNPLTEAHLADLSSGSSGDDEADEEDAETKQHRQQQSPANNPTSNKNRKRNRNKRKGNKK